jgi:hypothetical protein
MESARGEDPIGKQLPRKEKAAPSAAFVEPGREPRKRTGRSFPVCRIGPGFDVRRPLVMARPVLGHEAPFQYGRHIFLSPPHALPRMPSRVKKPGPVLPDVPFSPIRLYTCPLTEASCDVAAAPRFWVKCKPDTNAMSNRRRWRRSPIAVRFRRRRRWVVSCRAVSSKSPARRRRSE